MTIAPRPTGIHADRASNVLTLRRLGIDTYQEWVLYMSVECPVCRSEGWNAQSRVQVSLGDRSIVATLNVVTGDRLSPHEAGLSDAAWRALEAREGGEVALAHPPPLDSLRHVRAKVYGGRVDEAGFTAVSAGNWTGGDPDASVVYYATAADIATAQLVADMLGIGTVQESAEQAPTGVVVVLATDYEA